MKNKKVVIVTKKNGLSKGFICLKFSLNNNCANRWRPCPTRSLRKINTALFTLSVDKYFDFFGGNFLNSLTAKQNVPVKRANFMRLALKWPLGQIY